MTRNSFTALLVAAALPVFAQQAAPAAADAQKTIGDDAIVATINGEQITVAKLNHLWERAGTRARDQYMKNGNGKMGFLENYIKKRLVLQEAFKQSFQDQAYVKQELESARESALFDLYIRDVIATQIVPESAIREFYEQNKNDFVQPARAHIRHILATTSDKSPAEAREKLAKVMQELMPYHLPAARGEAGAKEIFRFRFAEAAKKYSEDTTAANGGDLGWMYKEKLDEKFAETAFKLPVGVMSGIIESSFGLHLILVEARDEEGIESYETARSAIREFLMSRDAAKVVETVSKLSNELRRTSKVALFPENIE
jgi:peptidyl-prolyl cis-trans isomerase C